MQQQQQTNVQNPFASPFPGLPFSGLDPATIMQLSQILGNSTQHASMQQNAKQQLDAAILHQHLQQASELQKPGNLPSFGNNNRRLNVNPPPNGNDIGSDKKRVSPMEKVSYLTFI